MYKTIIFILFCINLISAQNSYQALHKVANQVKNDPALANGFWSCYAVNSETGEVIIDIDSEKSLAPASNQKLLTSAAALAMLGANDTLHTYLEYSGTISNNILTGNIYIRGEGDPTLGSCEFDSNTCLDKQNEKWVRAIRALGINQIDGNIVGDDRFLDHMPLPGGWLWTDIGNYYAPTTSGLCINENLYHLYFKPARYVGGPAEVIRTDPKVPGLTFFNHMKTGNAGSGDHGFIYAAPWQNVHQLEGTIPAGVKEFSIKGSLPDPAMFAAQLLKESLANANINVKGEALSTRYFDGNNEKRTIFHVTNSPALHEIVYRLNKKSVNLYAEQLLKIIGRKVGNEGSLEKGIEMIENWLKEKKISNNGVFIHDGSGLSMIDRLTGKFLVELLLVMKQEPAFDVFYNSLPIAGNPAYIGTLSGFCRNTRAANNIRAKTGSLERVRAISGYVHSRSGDLLCFSMIANDYSGSSARINNLHERVMIELAEVR